MLDLKVYEESRVLRTFEEPVVIKDEAPFVSALQNDTSPQPIVNNELVQFRYVVHRQHVGFFTPVVFDVEFHYTELEGEKDRSTEVAMKYILEPFVEGALFMNHDSQFIFNMLKGQDAGYDRKQELDKIKRLVEETDSIWYSDWQTPPITQQSQRIVIYDLDMTGSFLDPRNAVRQVLDWITMKRGRDFVHYAAIVAGYTNKTV